MGKNKLDADWELLRQIVLKSLERRRSLGLPPAAEDVKLAIKVLVQIERRPKTGFVWPGGQVVLPRGPEPLPAPDDQQVQEIKKALPSSLQRSTLQEAIERIRHVEDLEARQVILQGGGKESQCGATSSSP